MKRLVTLYVYRHIFDKQIIRIRDTNALNTICEYLRFPRSVYKSTYDY